MAEQPNDPNQENPKNEPAPSGFRPQFSIFLVMLLLAVLVVMLLASPGGSNRGLISYSKFEEQVKDHNVKDVLIDEAQITGEFIRTVHAREEGADGKIVEKKDKNNNPIELPSKFRVNIRAGDAAAAEATTLLTENGVEFAYKEQNHSMVILGVLFALLPLVVLLLIWNSFRRSRDQIMGGGFLSGFSKSPAKKYEANRRAVTFNDVAGLEGVKSDLQEIVDFLRKPEKFQRLGGQVPKGVLLIGPPGTGKTLLARAIAGEAGVPFYSVSGSEFIQMFVGVGASRVRDLFKTAKDNAPSIVFIDEIDAVGRQRGAGLGGGHDEREQTLNQILSEMDGFTQGETVIVVAATNRPDVLDPALLRPGRFDRHITVDRPSLKGRLEIFKVHVKNVPLSDDVSMERLAAGSVGLTGADIRNLINEAALWATRQDKTEVHMIDFEYARDKILMGARREETLVAREKEKTAYHEAGHALLAWLLPGVDRLHKVTVIPRGRALGVTQTVPEEERMNVSESELFDKLAFILGGRAAEKIAYEELSAGAENDLERATKMVRRMVTQWGMSERIGPVSYKMSGEDPFLGREMHESRLFSEHTMQVIDEEIARILHDAAKRAYDVLLKNRDKLESLTKELCDKEELSDVEITALIGPSVHALRKTAELEEIPYEASNGMPGVEAPPRAKSEEA